MTRSIITSSNEKVAFLDGGHEHLVGNQRSTRCNLRIRRLRNGNWRRAHHLCTTLWNRNYFLRFRFRFLLLKSYGSDFWKSHGSGSGSYFWKVTVPVPVPSPYLDHKKQIFQEKCWTFFAFLPSKLFYKEKVYKFQQIYVKCEWNFVDEGNQIHNLISSSGSGTEINYGSGSDFLTSYGSDSGSTSQKVTVPTVPVPVPKCCLCSNNVGNASGLLETVRTPGARTRQVGMNH